MTRTFICRRVPGLFLGLATISIGCGSEPPVPPSSALLTVPPCSEGVPSTTEGSLTTQVISSAGRGASGMALDDGHVYLKSAQGVFSALKTGGPLTPFDGVAPLFPRADSVTDGASEYRVGSGGLVRVSTDGSAVAVAPGAIVSEECFAITQRLGALYWTGADGILSGATVRNGSPRVLDSAGGSDCDDDYEGLAVAADETGVYWIAGEPGQRTSDEQPLTLYRTCRSP